jgi:hypothetical protein
MSNRFVLLLATLLVLTSVYAIGIEGIFLLDDYGTLAALGNWGEIDTLEKWFNYVTSAYNGPNGRMVAVASFTLNANTWPITSAAHFLATNIAIHCANFLLIYIFLRKFLLLCNVTKAEIIALFAACVWALHPLQVSTVLYVVQRMAQLELTFNVLALLCYLSTTMGRCL